MKNIDKFGNPKLVYFFNINNLSKSSSFQNFDFHDLFYDNIENFQNNLHNYREDTKEKNWRISSSL